MEYEVEGARTKTTKENFDRDCARKLNREDAIDCNRWRQQVKDD